MGFDEAAEATALATAAEATGATAATAAGTDAAVTSGLIATDAIGSALPAAAATSTGAETIAGTAGFGETIGSLLPSAGTMQLAGLGLSAGGAVMGGLQRQQMLSAESKQYAQQGKEAAIQAQVEDAQRTDRLTRTLSAQAAIFGAGGTDPYSGSAAAIGKATRTAGNLDISIANMNGQDKIYQSKVGQSLADQEGQNAVIGGLAGAGKSLFDLAKTKAAVGDS